MRAPVRILAVLFGLGIACAHATEPARLTSLEWPPFTGYSLPEGGLATLIVTRAFAVVDLPVEVAYLPWQRAVAKAKSGEALGVFPEYADAVDCALSAPIGRSPLGLAHAGRFDWSGDLDDLDRHVVGTVAGYVNTDAFDARVAAKRIRVDVVADDLLNLRKVASGRIAVAVVDANVLSFLRSRHSDLAAVRMHERLLETKSLHVCFNRAPGTQALLERFNAALKQINIPQIERDYLIGLRGGS